jgi:hypothetical protein
VRAARLEEASVSTTYSDSYYVFSTQAAILHAKSTALSKLNVAMVHQTRALASAICDGLPRILHPRHRVVGRAGGRGDSER